MTSEVFEHFHKGERVLVTLKSPIYVLLNHTPTPIVGIDGDIEARVEPLLVFGARRLMRAVAKALPDDRTRDYKVLATIDWITIRVAIGVPHDNIAGMIPMPKDGK